MYYTHRRQYIVLWYRISGNKVDVLYPQKAVHRTVVQDIRKQGRCTIYSQKAVHCTVVKDIREQGRCTILTEGSTLYCGTGYQGTR